MQLLRILLYILASFIIFIFLFIMLLFISSLFINTKKYYDKNSKYYRFLLNSSTFLMMLLLRIHVHTTGLEKVPQDTRFVLVGNHLSKFDPILQWFVLRKYDIAFISKIENFNVPIFGRFIRKCCFRAIDRENPGKAMDTIRDATKLIKNDEVSIGVYPEGTRGTGDGLLPFHNGVCYRRNNAKCPIGVMNTKKTRNKSKN